MKTFWRRPTVWIIIVTAGAIVLSSLLTGCDRAATPEQLRPTYGVDGQCFEADDEPCDDDPFDTDDGDIHLPKPSKKATPRPMITANQPAPTRAAPLPTRRATAPVVVPPPVKKRR